jgi:hypothetical protein
MSPAFKPTAEQRESVELMISYGAPEFATPGLRRLAEVLSAA